jgi:hypothetical protein
MQCLARHVLRLPSLHERRAFLRRFEIKNGKSITQKLKDFITQEHEKCQKRKPQARSRQANQPR